MRYDEIAAQGVVDKNKKSDSKIKSGLKNLATAGLTAGGVGIASKIMPFLSEFIPQDLAYKGINKIAPQVGQFLKRGVDSGLDLKSGLNYLKESFTSKSGSSAPNKNNIIEQYSPELFQFLKEEIESGRAPIEAGAIAQSKNHFKEVIKKMSKDHKTDFSSIIETIFGNAQQPKEQMQEKPGQNPGGIDPQLLSIMQNMQETMNKLSGG